MSETLFDKYGGVPTVTELVRDFHERLMRRPHIRRYFADMPTDKIISHHIEYVTFALGKPRTHVSINQLHDQHMTAGVTKASHNLMIDLFVDALQDNGFTDEDIETIVARLQSVTGEIVTKGIEK
ncbi:COG2346 Truncated hemoglobins [Oxalobacteraceae bacterium]